MYVIPSSEYIQKKKKHPWASELRDTIESNILDRDKTVKKKEMG